MITLSYCIIILFLIVPLNCDDNAEESKPNIMDEYHTIIKYVSVILFSLHLLYGITGNALMLIVFCITREKYFAFILIATQLIICNFLSFSSQIAVVLPEILLRNSSNGKLIYLCIFTLLQLKVYNHSN